MVNFHPTVLWRTCLVALVLVYSHNSILWGQFETATLTGTVSDQQGAIVTSAAVKLTNEATNAEFSTVTDEDDLAPLGCVSRARITHIMNLLHLAPDIQEELLLLSATTDWRDEIHEHNLRAVAAVVDFAGQRKRFHDLKQRPRSNTI